MVQGRETGNTISLSGACTEGPTDVAVRENVQSSIGSREGEQKDLLIVNEIFKQGQS